MSSACGAAQHCWSGFTPRCEHSQIFYALLAFISLTWSPCLLIIAPASTEQAGRGSRRGRLGKCWLNSHWMCAARRSPTPSLTDVAPVTFSFLLLTFSLYLPFFPLVTTLQRVSTFVWPRFWRWSSWTRLQFADSYLRGNISAVAWNKVHDVAPWEGIPNDMMCKAKSCSRGKSETRLSSVSLLTESHK